jgi:hypothetical protein
VLYGSLLLAESTARMSFALGRRRRHRQRPGRQLALGIVAAPVLSLTVVPLAFAGRAGLAEDSTALPGHATTRRSSRWPVAADSRPPCS